MHMRLYLEMVHEYGPKHRNQPKWTASRVASTEAETEKEGARVQGPAVCGSGAASVLAREKGAFCRLGSVSEESRGAPYSHPRCYDGARGTV